MRLQEVNMKKPFLKFISISILGLLFTSCTMSQAQTDLPTSTPPPATSTETIPPTATVEETPTQAETETPTPLPLPTFPLELTQTPGIFQTATAFASTATQDYLNNLSAIGPMADLLSIGQYFNPVGAPLTSWNGVPIMPQASAGQEFKADIYSFRALVNLDAASQFYKYEAVKQNWICFTASSSAGTGSNADHSFNMLCQGTNIVITSFDNNPSQVIVVINKAP
jgi:hypothetical protein